LRRILITGGTGFVGTHLVRHLQSTPSQIIVVSYGSNASLHEPGIEYRRIDIRNRDEVHSVMREFTPDMVYHLAAVSAIGPSWSNPRLTFEVNVLGSFNIFEAAMNLPSPPRILNISTAQVYARSSGPLSENSPLNPENPYAASKAMTELLMIQYRNCMNGGIITARSFNHTGPGQLPTFVLSSIAKQLAAIEAGQAAPTLKVGNIAVTRDFTDVRDIVIAYDRLLEKGRSGEVYNVCSGRPVLLANVIKEFQMNCRASIKVEVDQDRVRPSDVAQMVGDPTKIRTATGWEPDTPLETTIRDLQDYWRGRISREGLTPANGFKSEATTQ
jgi:GDP-4-dehydro-6-deoxy-D-mannose reductase